MPSTKFEEVIFTLDDPDVAVPFNDGNAQVLSVNKLTLTLFSVPSTRIVGEERFDGVLTGSSKTKAVISAGGVASFTMFFEI
jgi:hypothetical protein